MGSPGSEPDSEGEGDGGRGGGALVGELGPEGGREGGGETGGGSEKGSGNAEESGGGDEGVEGGDGEQGGQKARSVRRRAVGGVERRGVAAGLEGGVGRCGWHRWQKARWREGRADPEAGSGLARDSASMASMVMFQQAWQTKWRQLKTTIKGMFSEMGGSRRQSMQRVEGRGKR